jgi:choline dehydrogenase-like flavoprotein
MNVNGGGRQVPHIANTTNGVIILDKVTSFDAMRCRDGGHGELCPLRLMRMSGLRTTSCRNVRRTVKMTTFLRAAVKNKSVRVCSRSIERKKDRVGTRSWPTEVRKTDERMTCLW